jgi:nucleoside 2-deoxyribosyltransferase
VREFKVFIAGWFDARPIMNELASILESEGFVISSRWIQTAKDVPDFYGLHDSTLKRAAYKDIEDIDASDLVILVNPKRHHGHGRGGRHWEMGYAYAKGKPIIIVGEPENIYHFLDDVTKISMGTPLDRFVDIVKKLRGDDENRD